MPKKELLGLLLLFVSLRLLAQPGTAYFAFQWSNDLFYLPAPTDHYYTNGLTLDLALPILQNNPLNHTLLRTGKEALQTAGLQLTQDMFTPIRKDTLAIFPDDRPFASVLTLHSYLHSTAPQRRMAITAEWQLGVLGPAAGGGLTQNFIHGLTPQSEEVIGWRNEVRTDVVLNYNLELEKGLFYTKYLQAWLGARARLGTLHTDLTSGVHLQAGLFEDRFSNLRGWGRRPFRLLLHSSVAWRLAAYDATIQGGLFRVDSRYREVLQLKPLQEQWELGLEMSYRSFGIQAGVRGAAAPFTGGSYHRWGYLSFFWRGKGQ